MPLYDFRCDQGHTTEITGSWTDITETVPCSMCARVAKRVFHKPMVPLLGGDASSRRRRRRPPGDLAIADEPKARRRL